LPKKKVRFRWTDIYYPDPLDLSQELFGDIKLKGEVLDVTKNQLTQETLVVVLVESVKSPLIVPLSKVTFLETGKDDNCDDWKVAARLDKPMSTALRATSLTLAQKIQKDLDSDPALGFKGVMVVSLNTPKEMIDKSFEGVSVWLYRVIRDEETLNAPPQRQGFGSIKRSPLPMRLHYLITPIVDKKDPKHGGQETEQYILGKILQIFHDCPMLRGADLQDYYSGTEVELNVRLETLNLEEITRIWEAVEGSYQLSVSYEVGVVNIESGIEPERVAPVTVVLPEQGIIVSSWELEVLSVLHRAVEANNLSYNFSPDDQPAFGNRVWALISAWVVDEMTGQPAAEPITVETDLRSVLPRVASDGLVGLTGIPMQVFPAPFILGQQ